MVLEKSLKHHPWDTMRHPWNIILETYLRHYPWDVIVFETCLRHPWILETLSSRHHPWDSRDILEVSSLRHTWNIILETSLSLRHAWDTHETSLSLRYPWDILETLSLWYHPCNIIIETYLRLILETSLSLRHAWDTHETSSSLRHPWDIILETHMRLSWNIILETSLRHHRERQLQSNSSPFRRIVSWLWNKGMIDWLFYRGWPVIRYVE